MSFIFYQNEEMLSFWQCRKISTRYGVSKVFSRTDYLGFRTTKDISNLFVKNARICQNAKRIMNELRL